MVRGSTYNQETLIFIWAGRRPLTRIKLKLEEEGH